MNELPIERHHRILAILGDAGRAQVSELARTLNVSTMTVRRDLRLLEERGLIVRGRGGAVPAALAMRETPYAVKTSENTHLKRAIASAALQMVADGDTLILDAGSTTLELARLLAGSGRQVTVITNDMHVALELADAPGVTVMSTGGRVQCGIHCLLGDDAVSFLRNVHVNLAFIGAGAVDIEGGVYTPTPEKVPLKRAMIAGSNRAVLLVDHTKFGRRALRRVCGLEEIDAIVSDDLLDAGIADRLRAMNLGLTLARVKSGPAAGSPQGEGAPAARKVDESCPSSQ